MPSPDWDGSHTQAPAVDWAGGGEEAGDPPHAAAAAPKLVSNTTIRIEVGNQVQGV